MQDMRKVVDTCHRGVIDSLPCEAEFTVRASLAGSQYVSIWKTSEEKLPNFEGFGDPESSPFARTDEPLNSLNALLHSVAYIVGPPKELPSEFHYSPRISYNKPTFGTAIAYVSLELHRYGLVPLSYKSDSVTAPNNGSYMVTSSPHPSRKSGGVIKSAQNKLL